MKFEAPSDWTISLMYNAGFTGGEIIIKSKVEHYTEKDVKNI